LPARLDKDSIKELRRYLSTVRMGLPWRFISASSLVVAYLTTSRWTQWSNVAFATTFAGAWAIHLLAWVVWTVILYPKVFSPLRGLPEPKNSSWFMGQYRRIAAEPTGIPMLDWCVREGRGEE
jgi:hypothetical protein